MAAFDGLFGDADQATDTLYAYADQTAPGSVDRDSFSDRLARKTGGVGDWSDHSDPYDEYFHIRHDLASPRQPISTRPQKPSTDFSEQGEPAGKETAPDFSSAGVPVGGTEPAEKPEAPEQPPAPLGVGGQIAAGGKAAVQAGAAGVTEAMKGAAALPEIEQQAYAQGGPKATLEGGGYATRPQTPEEAEAAGAAYGVAGGPFRSAIKAREREQAAAQEQLAKETAVPPQDRPMYQAAEKMQKAVEGFAPLSDQEKDSIGGKIGSFIGSAATPVAMTLAGSAIGMPELGLVMGATQMGMQNAGASFERALNAGASPEQAAKAAGLDGLVGAAVGGLPLGAILAPVKMAGKPIIDLAGNEIGRQAAPGLMGWMAVKLEQAVKSGITFATVGEAQEWLSKQIASEYNSAAIEKLQNDKATVQRQLDRIQSDPKIAEANKDIIEQGKKALTKFDEQIADVGKYKLDWERVAISFFGGGALGMLHPHDANAQTPQDQWPPFTPPGPGTGLGGTGTPPPGGGGAGGAAGGRGSAGAGGATGTGPSSPGAGGTPPPRTPRPPPNDTPRQASMRGTFEGAMGRAGVDVEENLPFDELRDAYHAFDGLKTAYKRADLNGMHSSDLVDFFSQLSALNNHGFEKADLEKMSRADVAREYAEMVKQGGSAGPPPPPPGAEQPQQPGQAAGAGAQPPPGAGPAAAAPGGETPPQQPPSSAPTPETAGPAPGARQNPIELNSADDVARAGAVASQDHSHAQGEAHNVQQGWGRWNGIDISIEAPAGGVRRGTNPETGEPWDHRVAVTTGYIPGVKGADGDDLDVYVGPQPQSPTVFVLDENDPETGKFRQTKSFIGLTDPREAVVAYLGTQGKTPNMIGGITPMTVPQFKSWVSDGDHKVPVRGQVVPPAQTMEFGGLPAPSKVEEPAGGPAPPEGQGGRVQGNQPSAPPSLAQEHQTEPEHVAAIETAIANTGIQPHTVAPNDIALAAELHAHGLPPDLAFELAVLRNAVDNGYLTEKQLVDIYGKQKAESALSGISSVVNPVKPSGGAHAAPSGALPKPAAAGGAEENGVVPHAGAHEPGGGAGQNEATPVQVAPHAGGGVAEPAVNEGAGGGGGGAEGAAAAGHERPSHAHGGAGEATHHAAGRPGERPGQHAENAKPATGAENAEAAPAAKPGEPEAGAAPAHSEAAPSAETAAKPEAAPAEAATTEAAGEQQPGEHGVGQRDLLDRLELHRLADEIEATGTPGAGAFAHGLRARANNPKIAPPSSLDYIRQKLKEFQAQSGKKEENPKETYGIKDMLDKKEDHLFEQIKDSGKPEAIAELLKLAEDKGKELVDKINGAGFKVHDVNSSTSLDKPDIYKAKGELMRLGGTVSRLLKGLIREKGDIDSKRVTGDIKQLHEALGIERRGLNEALEDLAFHEIHPFTKLAVENLPSLEEKLDDIANGRLTSEKAHGWGNLVTQWIRMVERKFPYLETSKRPEAAIVKRMVAAAKRFHEAIDGGNSGKIRGAFVNLKDTIEQLDRMRPRTAEEEAARLDEEEAAAKKPAEEGEKRELYVKAEDAGKLALKPGQNVAHIKRDNEKDSHLAVFQVDPENERKWNVVNRIRYSDNPKPGFVKVTLSKPSEGFFTNIFGDKHFDTVEVEGTAHSEAPKAGERAVSPYDVTTEAEIPRTPVDLGVIYRGVEGGTDEQAALRHFVGGDLGDGIYFTNKKNNAETYGGGPKASIKAGTRVVHSYQLTRPLGPHELAYLFGNAAKDTTVRIVRGTGELIYDGKWDAGRKKPSELNKAIETAGGVSAVIGTPKSIGLNQLVVRDRSLLEPATAAEEASEPQVKLVRAITKVLDEDKGITTKRLQDLANEAYGGKLAEGAFDRKDMFDALETAVNVTIAKHPGLHLGFREMPEVVNQKLEELLSKLPTQTVRSEEQVKFQQFSTPPNYAMAVAYAAGLRNGDVVLEPSAGTGSLVAAATHPGVAVHANELSPRRAALLQQVMDVQHVVEHNKGRLTKENAEQLDNILPEDIKPTVVLMNPPFSQTAGRMGDKKDLMVAANHIDQALKRLEPGGRLVAIVGHGMSMISPTYRDWWKKIQAKYSVQANIGVDGDIYKKYGTTFGTRVLVIDKIPPAAQKFVLTKDVKSVSDLLGVLKGVRNARIIPVGEQGTAQPGGAPLAGEGQGAGGRVEPAHPAAGAVGTGRGGANRVPEQGPGGGGGAGGPSVSVETEGQPGVAGGPSGNGIAGGAGEKPAEHAGGGKRPGHGGERPAGVDLQSPAGAATGAAAGGVGVPWDLKKLKERAGYWEKRLGDTHQFQDLIVDPKTRKPFEDQRAIVETQAELERDYKAAMEHVGRNDGGDDINHPDIGRPWSGTLDIVRSRLTGTLQRFERFPQVKAAIDKARGEPVVKKPEKSETVAPPPGQPEPYTLDTLKARADYWSKRTTDTHNFDDLIGDPRKPHEDQRPIFRELAEAERDWDLAHKHVQRNGGVDIADQPGKGRPWSGVIQYIPIIIKEAIDRVERNPRFKPLFDKAREELAKAEQKAAGAAGPPPGEKAGLEEVKKPTEQKKTEFTEGLYEHYEPQKVKVKGSQPHPGPLVESASMATVPPPDAKYQPSLPKNVVETGALSTAQLEPIVYAGQAHSQMLPHGENEAPRRKGYFIGDGTGVGKGREIAGIILDNWNQGRKKAVWVSEKKTLLNDAKRDWKGLGQNPELIFDFGKIKAGEPIKAVNGVSFVTYDTLKGGMSDQAALAQGSYIKGDKVKSRTTGATGVVTGKAKGKGRNINVPVLLDNGTKIELNQYDLERTEERQSVKSRVDQLVDWLGKDFDGVIAFDESHNLGNSVQQQGDRGTKGAAMKALAGVQLAERLPKARVVYVSATGATEVSNLSYADRLGLWGRGTPFANRENFVSEVESGGIAAMELIARDMKQMGLYTARNLSYDGVEYGRVEHKLNADQREIYDTLAVAWQHVLQNINAALEVTGGDQNARAKSAAKSAFWGAHQRFFNQIITSLQMPSVIKAVERDIKDGRQAVLQLTNTNAASQERAAAKAETAEDIEDMDITPRDQLIQLIEKSFPTQQYEEYEDEKGNKGTRPVVDSEGNPVENKEAVRMRDALIERVATVRVPQGPLDMILDHFGYENVAEVTGRGRRFIMKEDAKGIRRRMEDPRPASANVSEADAFQNGKKKILVFSDAGGTGRSYHADNTAPSAGARRSHYLVQGGWRADKAVQGFGRTHRTNQASAPIFNLVTTDLHGQKRFISSIARRLAQLGALTKGERAAGDQGIFGARDNLESTEAKQALRSFFTDLYSGKLEISLREFERQTGLAIAQRDKDGNDQGMRNDLPEITQFLNRLLSLNIDEQNATFEAFSNILDSVIEARRQAGVLDQGLETVKADKIRKDSEKTVFKGEGGAETKYVKFTTSNRFVPIPFKAVIGNNARPVIGWVKSPQGRVWALSNTPSYTNEAGKIIDNYRVTGPSGTRIVPQDTINGSYSFPSKWTKIQEPDARKLWEEEIKNAPEFVDGDLHLITGAILPIWDRLKGQTRVVRLQTDEGERYLGRVVPAGQLSVTLKALGAEGGQEKIDASKAFPALQNGAIATLANGWKIMRRLVAGEPRIEITGGISFGDANQLLQDGVFAENIQFKRRYFIPNKAEGAKVLERVIQYRPIVSLEGAETGGRFEMFGGPKGATANLQNLDTAKALKAAGESPHAIWERTGWMERADGWRYEIDDSQVQFKKGALDIKPDRYDNRWVGHKFEARKVKGEWVVWDATAKELHSSQQGGYSKEDADWEANRLNAIKPRVEHRFYGKLGDLVEAKGMLRISGEAPFLRAYPFLKDKQVTIGPSSSFTAVASVDRDTGAIKINGSMPTEEVLKSLLHEIQHIIQRHEGFDSGGHGGTLSSRTRAALYEIEQQIKTLRPGSNIRAELEQLRNKLADQADLFSGGVGGWSQTNEESDAYHRLLGEVEARNTEFRRLMSAKERAAKLPTETEDVPSEEQYRGTDLVQMTPKLKAAVDRAVRDEWRGYVPDSRYNGMSLSPAFGGENNPKPMSTSRSNISASMKFTPQSVADAIRIYGGRALIDHIDQHISYAQTGPIWQGKPIHIDHKPHPKQIETLEHVRGVIQRVIDRYPDAAEPSGYAVRKMDPEGLIDRYAGKTWTEDDVNSLRGRVEDAIEEMWRKGELTEQEARELSYDFRYQGMTIAEWHPEGFAKVYAKIPKLLDEFRDAYAYVGYSANKSSADLSYKLSPTAAVKQTAIEQLIRKQLEDMVGRHVDIDLSVAGDLGASQTWGKLASMEGDQTPAAYYPRRSKLSGRPLHGTIQIAMGGNRPFKNLRSLANHEAVHALIDLAATDQEIEVLKRERARNGPKVQEALGLTDKEMEELNPDEIDAVAGEMYMDEKDAGGFGTGGGWHVALRALWERIRKFLRSIGNALRGMGFQTSEDIFERMRQGEMRDRPMRESFGMEHTGWRDEAQTGQRAEAPFAMFNRSRQRKQQQTAGQRVQAQMKSMPTRAVRYWADKMIDVLNVQRQIERATGQSLPPEQQPYLHETLYGGRTGERALDLERKYTMPILDDLRANGISRKDFDDYLYARHAQARNAFVARINPRMPDGGSGMKNNEAQAILNYANGGPKAAAFQRNAQRVYDMLDESLRNQVAYGLVSQQWANDVRRDFGQEYVPLKGFEEFELPPNETVGQGAGPAYTVSGRENAEALGRRSEATQILANAVLQATNTFIRGEKNRVVGALYQLATAHPDPSLWTLSNTEKKRFKDANGQVVERSVPVNRSAPNVLVHKIGGQEHAIILHHQPIADAMKALGVDDAGEVVRRLRYTMQVYGRLRTSLSPEFVLKNFERDQTDASVAVTGRYGAKGAAQYVKNMPTAIKGAWDVALNRPSAAHALYDRFRLAGGKMSFIKGTNIENIAHEIQQHMERGRVRAMFDKTVEALEIANDVTENATRMNLFATALHFGASDEEAASMALEGTINFRRKGKGAIAQVMAALWPFFNANVQSVLRYGRMLAGRQVSSLWPISKKVARGFMGAMMAGGFLSTLFNIHVGGHNEPRGQSYYHDVPEYEKMNNIIMMSGMKDKEGQPVYTKIPMFSEAMAPWRAGALAAEWAFDHRSTGYVTKQYLITMANMIPGLGSSHMGIPTLANIPLSIYMNENNFGGKIHPEPSWFSHEAHEPASQVKFPSTDPIWQSIAETVGQVGGGDKYRTPWVPGTNLHPEDIKFITNEIGGGLWGFATSGINLVHQIVNGVSPGDIDIRQWPILRQYWGHNYNVQISHDFSEARKSAEEAAEAVRRGDKREDTRKEAATAGFFKGAGTRNSALNKEEARTRANPKLSLAEIEKRIQELEAKRTQTRAEALRRAEGVAPPTPLPAQRLVATPTAPRAPPPRSTSDLIQRLEQAR